MSGKNKEVKEPIKRKSNKKDNDLPRTDPDAKEICNDNRKE